MKQANVIALTFLALGLFISGIVLVHYATLSLGLIIAGVAIACTTVAINEIRDAKREIIGKIERRNGSL